MTLNGYQTLIEFRFATIEPVTGVRSETITLETAGIPVDVSMR